MTLIIEILYDRIGHTPEVTMAIWHDTKTSLYIGNTGEIPLSLAVPSQLEIDQAFSTLILSASGWRKIFALSGKEEDTKRAISLADTVIVAHMANVFADFLLTKPSIAQKMELTLALDTRPTGSEIGNIMCRVFLARGFTVRYLYIASAPEIMAYARNVGAFAYISASHNPIGHNGVKFGLNDGGVLAGNDITPLIASLKAACTSSDATGIAHKLLASCDPITLTKTWENIDNEKKKALAEYESFSREVISGESNITKRDDFFRLLKVANDVLQAQGKPASIVADFNGSARCVSIDRHFFEASGIALTGMNEKAGKIAHRIVPEGESLSYCAREIERLHREGKTEAEKNVILGYVPDCDGDRGNIVYWNDHTQQASILEAQEVFALSVVAELAHLRYLEHTVIDVNGTSSPPSAIAVNDPTSLRIEEIAKSFGATVARAEVGEANVVNLARSLRENGAIVRILGEGSNGGNITHPAAVRDPLNTVFAILKLLAIRDTETKKGLFHLWCSVSGQESKYKTGFTLADIMHTLPAYVTTSVFEKDAMLAIHTTDHAKLKRNFQKVFMREWNEKKNELHKQFGFTSWVAISNNGTQQTNNLSDFGDSGKGGLKIQFLGVDGKPLAFIWMRGSGTEAVFRILADARGNDISIERYLLSSLTSMVLEADGIIE